MSADFEAYRAEINAIETQEFDHIQTSTGGWTLGTSVWDQRIDELRQIQQKHGIATDDPRIISIAAYEEERNHIVQELKALGSSDERLPQWSRLEFALANCRGRFFPQGTLAEELPVGNDSVPMLWYYVQSRLNIRYFIGIVAKSKNADGPAATPEDVQKVYTTLHEHRPPLSWAPDPPYPKFTNEEARDELLRIASMLEQEDLARCEAWRRKNDSVVSGHLINLVFRTREPVDDAPADPRENLSTRSGEPEILPDWIPKLFRGKQYVLLKTLWGKRSVPEDQLIDALEYGDAGDAQGNLRRRVTETNKNLFERAHEIGETWTISEMTREGMKSRFLHRQK
jgi:hypothetical protein